MHYTRAELELIAKQILGDRLPGRPRQGILEESQYRNYRIGTPLVMPEGDSRKLRYCKAGGEIGKVLIGLANDNGLHEGNSSGAATAGARTLTVLDDTGTLDQYADGLITIFTTHTQMLRIKGNTASSGGKVVLTLKDPLLYDVADGVFCGWYPNIYGNVVSEWSAQSGFRSFVVVSLIPVPAGHYFWGQTRGFCHGIPNVDPFGTAGNERDLYFWIDGSLRLTQQTDLTTTSLQRAGYLLPRTSAAGGDQAYMLQLE